MLQARNIRQFRPHGATVERAALGADPDHNSNQVQLVLAAIIDGQPASNGGTL